jgi:alginate O-acetyltransferase complex protein AlgI
MLFFFKYINFVIENINHLTKSLWGFEGITTIAVVLPLGISFYTFQVVSYVINVYTKKLDAEESIFHFALYVCMFPQLISGPLVEYEDMSSQIRERHFSIFNIERGLKVFTLGLGCKVLIADRIGILWNDIQTIGFESISTPLAWLGAIGYSLQLYFDFHGYTLMAIGVAEMLGFKLPSNFSHPYISRSVTEFWRRWHISLGKWFKNYVYIPLGGNRRGKGRLAFNLLVVWILTGLWHGANWNFVLWGLSLYFLILLEKLFLKDFLERHQVVSRIYIILVMPMTWMLFAITKLSDIKIYFGRLFGIVEGINVNTYDIIKYLDIYKWLFLAGIFFSIPIFDKWYRKHERSIPCMILLFLIFWCCIYQLANSVNNPFLYFNF